MYTPLRHGSSYGVVLNLLNLSSVLAKPQQGFQHAVQNITSTETTFDSVNATHAWNYNTTIATPAPWTSAEQCPTVTSTPTIYSLVYTSPNASPVAITTQSQVVTSYLPQMVQCAGPPIARSPVVLPAPSAPFPNATAPYLNTTVLRQYTYGTPNCKTFYTPIETTMCATTLTGLASKVTITKCDQQVTFSSECGFSLETPPPTTTTTTNTSIIITPAPTVKRLFTYWLAPWQSLTAGDTPPDVDVKICTARDDGPDLLDCNYYRETWHVTTTTHTQTSTHPVWLTATISGPETLIVESSSEVIATDTLKTIDLSTTQLLETKHQEESPSVARITSKRTSTVYVTKTLRRNSTGPSTTLSNSTSTILSTTFTTVTSTITVTRARHVTGS